MRDTDRDALRAIDRAFGQFIDSLEPGRDGDTLVGRAAALVSRQLGGGHICVPVANLPELAHTWMPELPLPGDAEEWQRRLAASPLVGDSSAEGERAGTPLVLDRDRLYLRRYFRYEQRVASAVAHRLATRLPLAPSMSSHLDRLFPASQTPSAETDWQKVACAIAARSAFSVVTGGPGTGKTTTVVKLLALLQTLGMAHGAAQRIRLAAPTGKAAARLNESIARQVDELRIDDAVKAALPKEVLTIHRLLGAQPGSRKYRHGAGNPLHVDILVIDEASMIDLEMMANVLEALPTSARLILLGDKDQLASVEAGSVLGDLCQRAEAGHYDAQTVAWIHEVSGESIDDRYRQADQSTALDQQVVMLRTSHRFAKVREIGALATAVNLGDAAAAMACLNEPSAALSWVRRDSRDAARAVEVAVRGYREYLQVLEGSRPAPGAPSAVWQQAAREGLLAFSRFQLLCAVREGTAGVTELNQAIALALHRRGMLEASTGWYAGRPVMVVRNDYALGLMNGDVGLTVWMPQPDGTLALRVAFLVAPSNGSRSSSLVDDPRQLRLVVPSRLSAVESVFAMTVHKSQGSEFEHTALVLPDKANPVLTRELLYTGITRAKSKFSLIGSEDVLRAAIASRTRRTSGLAERWA